MGRSILMFLKEREAERALSPVFVVILKRVVVRALELNQPTGVEEI